MSPMLQSRGTPALRGAPILRRVPVLGRAHTPVCSPVLAAAGACQPDRARWTTWRAGGSKRHKIRRVDYPWKQEILKYSWNFLKEEMVQHFQNQPERDSTVNLVASEWPRFTMKEELLEAGLLPTLIAGWGPPRRAVLNKAEIESIAFDEAEGHLSHLFKGRLFRIQVGEWIEECVVEDVAVHPVDQVMYFVRFRRHVPGKVTTLPIPVSLSGLWGCPGYKSGGHVELAMPTIDCECVGEHIPPPFIIDVTKLKMEHPYSRITLEDIRNQLPEDGTVRFARHYDEKNAEVVMCYDFKSVPEVPLPPEWEDPNFNHRAGRYHLTYTGFWPRQTTRS